MLEEIRGHEAELERMCRRYGVLRLELFGSAVSGRYRQGESDLDFLVEFDDMPRGAYADAYFDQALATRLTDHRRIIAFRNILIHGLPRRLPKRQ